ncbi:Uncharacterised protein r2_g3850 [Pycnogonum litorale]
MAKYDPECFAKITDHSNHERFLDATIPEMNWNIGENVIDVGCGPGCVSVKVLWPRLQRKSVESLTCIDCDENMVASSKSNYQHPNITFHRAQIENVDSIPSEWFGKFDKAFSFYVLQDIRNLRKAFGYVHQLLKPTGEIAFLFVSREPLPIARRAMLQKEKWRNILTEGGGVNTACAGEAFQADDVKSSFRKLLTECGFEPKSVKQVNVDHTFKNADGFTDFILAIDLNKQKIPKDRLEEYSSEIYQECLKVPYMGQERNRKAIDEADGSHVYWQHDTRLHAVKI